MKNILDLKSKIIVGTLFLFSLLACSPIDNAISDNSQIKKIEFGMERKENSDTIIFKLKNTGKEDLLVTPPGSNYSRLLFTTETGKTIEHYTWKTFAPPPMVEPGNEKTWDVDIKGVLGFYNLQDEKNLKLVWSVNGVESAPFILHKSD